MAHRRIAGIRYVLSYVHSKSKGSLLCRIFVVGTAQVLKDKSINADYIR